MDDDQYYQLLVYHAFTPPGVKGMDPNDDVHRHLRISLQKKSNSWFHNTFVRRVDRSFDKL